MLHILVLRICRTQLVARLSIQLLVGRTLELHEVDQGLCWSEIDEVLNNVRPSIEELPRLNSIWIDIDILVVILHHDVSYLVYVYLAGLSILV